MNELNLSILEEIGKKSRELRKEVSQMPKVGMDITELIDFVENKIDEWGYTPAFPCTVSVNEIAAHYTVFDEGYKLEKGDLIKIDFGLCKDGFVTDNATTVEVEDNKYEDMIKANFETMNAAIELIDFGVSMSEIGKEVNALAKDKGFNVIENLCGHEIGRNNLHFGLSVPNYDNGDKRAVHNDMQFAVEPFFTKGAPRVKNVGNSNILHLVKDKPVRDPIAKKVLKHIQEKYPHLPFSKRWLLKDFDKRKVLYALKILKSHNIIYEYEALASVDGCYVSQFEDCVVFVDNKKSIITRLR